LQPGEALSLFLQDLRQKLFHAMPDIDRPARDQLLLHQFLAGLPVSVSKQLRATGDVNKVDTALERARLLMALEVEGGEKPSMVTATTISEGGQQVQRLQEQVKELTNQVAALIQRNKSTQQQSSMQHCFYCDKVGHFQRNCPK